MNIDNNNFLDVIRKIKQDFRAYNLHTYTDVCKFLLTSKAFKQQVLLRIGYWLKWKKSIPARFLFTILWFVYERHQYKTTIQIPLGTPIGGGLRFYHFSSVVIAYTAYIGKNFTVFQDVTVGAKVNEYAYLESPNIGDNVVAFAGAKIIGNVHIGNYVVIGANAVVTKDIPDNAVCVGSPAKVISYDGPSICKRYINSN